MNIKELTSELLNLWLDYLSSMRKIKVKTNDLFDFDLETLSGVQKELNYIRQAFSVLGKSRELSDMFFVRFNQMYDYLIELEEKYESGV